MTLEEHDETTNLYKKMLPKQGKYTNALEQNSCANILAH